jgi:hypothetical protein
MSEISVRFEVGRFCAEMEALLYDSKQNQRVENSERYRLTE